MGVWQGTLEGLGMRAFSSIYQGKKVLVTGHTGFKGSWLTLWLSELGAEITGISLPPETEPNHWSLLGLSCNDMRLDIRAIQPLLDAIDASQPEIVFHLAAQPLVRRSYRDPLETWSTNVLGTANILEACRQTPSVRAIVVVTTDKCYENREWVWGYRETDALGGHDPYSGSKAAAELVATSYRKSFFNNDKGPMLATARAGNVIGGGDWSEDRLIPDFVRAVSSNTSLEIRSPNATRPWQHVLESLSGYLLLGQKLLEQGNRFAEPWNFGPDPEGNRTVSEVLDQFRQSWNNAQWHAAPQNHLHEANLLYLDSTKAQKNLGWHPVWDFETTLVTTADWYRTWLDDGVILSHQQLLHYVAEAANKNVDWAKG
jgi:CDP-glucose 4,6-dehydratase